MSKQTRFPRRAYAPSRAVPEGWWMRTSSQALPTAHRQPRGLEPPRGGDTPLDQPPTRKGPAFIIVQRSMADVVGLGLHVQQTPAEPVQQGIGIVVQRRQSQHRHGDQFGPDA